MDFQYVDDDERATLTKTEAKLRESIRTPWQNRTNEQRRIAAAFRDAERERALAFYDRLGVAPLRITGVVR